MDGGGPITTIEPLSDEEDGNPLAGLIADWLAYYGPMADTDVGRALGLSSAQLLPILDELIADQAVITGLVVDGISSEQLWDSGNFESLMRMTRADASPDFQTLPVEQLALFLGVAHGLHEPGNSAEALRRGLEPLLGYGAPAALWETEILPARLQSYTSSSLDSVLQESMLRWVGCGAQRLAFCFEADLDLLGRADQGHAEIDTSTVRALFPDPYGRYDFATLQAATGLDAVALATRLWDAVWAGSITNDTFAAVRHGAQLKFQPPETPAPPTHRAGSGRPPSRGPVSRGAVSRRPAGGRWQGGTIYPGTWRLLPEPVPAEDPLEEEERYKDRVRLLLDRYGVLFRELTQRELPAFRWHRLFRSLRLMELSGEILAGRFFDDIPGPQFASHRAFHQLTRGLPEDAIF